MTNFVFLNVLHDFSNLVAGLMSTLTEFKKDNPQYKIIIVPAVFILRVIKVLSKNTGQACYIINNQTIPWFIESTGGLLTASIPNTVSCFNKTTFLVFVADFYFILYGLHAVFERFVWTYIYFIVRLACTIGPFILMTPTERLPFWILGLGLIFVDCFVAIIMIWSWGYGIDWDGPISFYHHWGKHYRYRYATPNRQLTVELSTYAYILSKFHILSGRSCLTDKNFELRMKNPTMPMRASVQDVVLPEISYSGILFVGFLLSFWLCTRLKTKQ